MTSRTTIAAFVLSTGITVSPVTGHAQRPSAEWVPPAVLACGCHGSQGEGDPVGGTPRIAGQSAYYLSQQLESYADGSRRDRVMEPIARNLSPETRADVSAYYARIDAPFDERSRPERAPERGRQLAMEGDGQLGVAACRNCHGPGGVGEPPNIPYLGGLDATYLAAELRDWNEGTRTNDAGHQMLTVVRRMSKDDIAAVAQYYASLPPPKPAPPDLLQAPPQQDFSAGAASIVQPSDESRKPVGIEQGSPRKGGTEGTGGTEASENAGSDRDEGGASQGPGPLAPGTSARSIPWPRLSSRSSTAPIRLPSSAVSGSLVSDGDPTRGREIIASGVYGCGACHAIPGVDDPAGIVGPPLSGFGARGFIAGQLPNRPDILVAFLQNPPGLVPQTGMPDVGLTLEDARDIAAYLLSLQPSR